MGSLPEYLERKRASLAGFRDSLRSGAVEPTPLAVTCRVAGGSGARPVRVREFTIVTDSGPALAGNNLGPTAPELLLTALASCLAHSYVTIAADRGLAFDSLEVEVRGTIDYRGMLAVAEGISVPPYDLCYEATIATSAGREALAAVQAEVERLCPVLQALRQPLRVEGRVVTAPAG